MKNRMLPALLLCLVFTGACASGLTLPPISIEFPEPTLTTPTPAPAVVAPRATLAFQVTDACTGAPLRDVFARFADQSQKETNADGYVAFERDAGTFERPAIYTVTFLLDDSYEILQRDFALRENQQFPVSLRPAGGCAAPAAPEPPPVVVAPPAPPPAPIPPTPTAVACTGFACVQEAARRYPELLSINLFESCVEFTQRVLELLGPNWGHVGKTAGESQSVPRGFTPVDAVGSDGQTYRITGVSHDAIKHRITGQVIDLLGNATANEPCDLPAAECWAPGPANIQWADVPRPLWRASNPFVPAVPVR